MKNSFNKIILQVIILVCLSAGDFSNADRMPDSRWCSKNMHVSLDIGSSFINGGDISGYPDKKHNASALYGVGIGYNINKEFVLDLVFINRSNYQYKYPNSDFVPGVSGDSANSLSSSAFMIQGSYYPKQLKFNKLSPYISFGIGVSSNLMGDYTFSSDEIPGEITEYTLVGDSRSSFSWLIGIGSKIRLYKGFSTYIEYRYAGLGEFCSKGVLLSSYKDGFLKVPKDIPYTSVHEWHVGLIYKF